MAPNNTAVRRSFILRSIQACLIALVLLVSPMPVLALSLPAEPDQPVRLYEPAGREDASEWEVSEPALPDYRSFVEIVRNGEAVS